MKSLARWSAGHTTLVALMWVLAIVGVQVSAQVVGTDFRNSFALPGTDSQSAVDLLHEHFPEASGDADTIVITADGAKVTDPGVAQRAKSLLEDVAAIDSVTAVRSPYAPTGGGQISADGTVAYAACSTTWRASRCPAPILRPSSRWSRTPTATGSMLRSEARVWRPSRNPRSGPLS